MEKKKPHYNLSLIKELIAAGRVCATGSALAGGAALGFEFAGMLEVVEVLVFNEMSCLWNGRIGSRYS
jgi:motility quorum-sensing regulator / GCU-specific mRNA interferase toxin